MTTTQITPMLARIAAKLQPMIAELRQPTEHEQMEIDLINFRLSDADWEAPFARLTDEQLEEIEAERPGEHFSQYPYLY